MPGADGAAQQVDGLGEAGLERDHPPERRRRTTDVRQAARPAWSRGAPASQRRVMVSAASPNPTAEPQGQHDEALHRELHPGLLQEQAPGREGRGIARSASAPPHPARLTRGTSISVAQRVGPAVRQVPELIQRLPPCGVGPLRATPRTERERQRSQRHRQEHQSSRQLTCWPAGLPPAPAACGLPGRPVVHEQQRAEVYAVCLEPVGELGPDAARPEAAQHLLVFAEPWRSKMKMSCIVMTSPSMPTISEIWSQLARAIGEPAHLHHDVDRARDLLPHAPSRGGRGSPWRSWSRGGSARRAGCSRGCVVSEPSWPVFIAWSMSTASPPRHSPMMIRSGRMRSAFTSSSR